MDTLIERLANLAAYTCRAIIDDGHAISVKAAEGEENVVFEVTCEPGDVGLIIGSKGRNIEAIRTLVRSACRGETLRTAVEVTKSRR